MDDIKAGTMLRMAKTFEFDTPICKAYFPDGLTRQHGIVALDRPSVGRVTVLVQGVFAHDQSDQFVWENPHFRIPLEYVQTLEMAPELGGISIVEGKVHS